MTLIRRAQAAAATAERLPELPAHYRRTLGDMSGASVEELENASAAVEFLDGLSKLSDWSVEQGNDGSFYAILCGFPGRVPVYESHGQWLDANTGAYICG